MSSIATIPGSSRKRGEDPPPAALGRRRRAPASRTSPSGRTSPSSRTRRARAWRGVRRRRAQRPGGRGARPCPRLSRPRPAASPQAASAERAASAPEPAPRGERRRWIALAVLCLGQLMMVLDATIVNVALPSIQHDLHFTQGNLTWVMNGYLITFGGLLLLAGRLGDLVGRKRVFLTGLVAVHRRLGAVRAGAAARRC